MNFLRIGLISLLILLNTSLFGWKQVISNETYEKIKCRIELVWCFDKKVLDKVGTVENPIEIPSRASYEVETGGYCPRCVSCKFGSNEFDTKADWGRGCSDWTVARCAHTNAIVFESGIKWNAGVLSAEVINDTGRDISCGFSTSLFGSEVWDYSMEIPAGQTKTQIFTKGGCLQSLSCGNMYYPSSDSLRARLATWPLTLGLQLLGMCWNTQFKVSGNEIKQLK